MEEAVSESLETRPVDIEDLSAATAKLLETQCHTLLKEPYS